MTDQLTDRQTAEALFNEMHLTGDAFRLAWLAFNENPAGTLQVALGAFEGRKPSGIFVHRIRNGDHRIPTTARRRTGWRFVRGTHSASYIRDPKGTDPLPPSYGTTG